MNPYAFHMVVVFCYIISQGNVLLIKRNKLPDRERFTIVGGRKERGEDLVSACIREVYEETGLILQRPKYRGVLNIQPSCGDDETIAFYFQAEQFSGELQASDEGELMWCPAVQSSQLENISPFYPELYPYVFERDDPFIGLMQLDADGLIRHIEIE